jgi:hypothetical protein
MNAVQLVIDNERSTVQEAFRHVDELVQRSLKGWLRAQVDLPSWGEATDRDVQRYMAAMLDQARGTLAWSYALPSFHRI